MAAELVETSRLWGAHRRADRAGVGRAAGRAPGQAQLQRAALGEEAGRGDGVREGHAVRRCRSSPRRKVNYGRIDPELSRELFIRHALVEGDWETHHEFFHDNRELLDEVEELEHRARRRDILVDDETLFDFYDARIGPPTWSPARHFDSWWKKARRSEPDLLTFDQSMLVNEGAGGSTAGDYPDVWRQDGSELPLTYQFEPGTDGRRRDRPHSAAAAQPGRRRTGFDWQMPGLREELVTALIRSLPKALRAQLRAGARLRRARCSTGRAPAAARCSTRWRASCAGSPASSSRATLGPDRVPDHLRMTFRVVDEHGATSARARTSPRSSSSCAPQAAGDGGRGAPATGARGPHAAGDFGTLPAMVEQAAAGYAGHRLPGAGRRGRQRRGAGLRHRGRAGAGDVARAPAGCCCSTLPPPVQCCPGPAVQPGQAGAEPQPARQRRRPARRLRRRARWTS